MTVCLCLFWKTQCTWQWIMWNWRSRTGPLQHQDYGHALSVLRTAQRRRKSKSSLEFTLTLRKGISFLVVRKVNHKKDWVNPVMIQIGVVLVETSKHKLEEKLFVLQEQGVVVKKISVICSEMHTDLYQKSSNVFFFNFSMKMLFPGIILNDGLFLFLVFPSVNFMSYFIFFQRGSTPKQVVKTGNNFRFVIFVY